MKNGFKTWRHVQIDDEQCATIAKAPTSNQKQTLFICCEQLPIATEWIGQQSCQFVISIRNWSTVWLPVNLILPLTFKMSPVVFRRQCRQHIAQCRERCIDLLRFLHRVSIRQRFLVLVHTWINISIEMNPVNVVSPSIVPNRQDQSNWVFPVYSTRYFMLLFLLFITYIHIYIHI